MSHPPDLHPSAFPEGLKLVQHDLETSEEAKAILAGLTAYNSTFHGPDRWRELTIALKNADGKVMAGLNGFTDWNWLFVKLLWISDSLRGQDIGTRLLSLAEEEGRKRGCDRVWLDTFSFQARGFYEKLGYSVFGELEDYPVGHQRYFLWKKL